jgi:hypothetical protein
MMKALPHHRTWVITLATLAVVAVVAACSLGAFLVVNDNNQHESSLPTPSNVVPTRDISDRTVDPNMLTLADVFPGRSISPGPSLPPYVMAGSPQLEKDCRVAASGDVGKLLMDLGCNQVLRATVLSADRSYVITFGIFNLKDAASATQSKSQIQDLVAANKGRFNGYITNTSTKVLARAATKLSWLPIEHFLAYAVMARADGKEFATTDPNPRIFSFDLIETYLENHVIATWAIDHSTPTAARPTGSAS